MTRSTNMEHVEVLRGLSEVCRAAIAAGDWKVDGACDPDSLLRHADAAIASLSAPQPPAEAQAQGGGEVVAYSAKFRASGDWSRYPIGTRAYAIQGGHWERVENGWKWCTGSTFPTPGGDAIDVAVPVRVSAPPSAPVGVEDLSCCGGNDESPKSHCMDCSRYPGQLAQQPAAVDGGVSYPTPRNRQEAAALAGLALAYLGVTRAHIDAVIARCETDLAAQPGGSDNDH